MKNGTEALQKHLGQFGGHLATDVANIASTTSALVVHKASDAKDLVVDRGGDVLKSLSKVIKKNPIASVGIAFGIGFLAMRLIPLVRGSNEN